MKKETPILELIAFILVVVVSLWGFLQIKNKEVNFCRGVFSGLISGKTSVVKFISWEKLKAMDTDVGAAYIALPNEKAKLAYRDSFITGFADGFRRAKSSLRLFKHWRIYEKDDSKIIIAADYPKSQKTILFTLTKSVKPKLIGIRWR